MKSSQTHVQCTQSTHFDQQLLPAVSGLVDYNVILIKTKCVRCADAGCDTASGVLGLPRLELPKSGRIEILRTICKT